jgi:hypothetical protein
MTTTKCSTVFSLLACYTYLSESVCGVPLRIQQDTNNDANEVRSSSVVRCHVDGLEVPTLSNIGDDSVNQPQVALVFSSRSWKLKLKLSHYTPRGPWGKGCIAPTNSRRRPGRALAPGKRPSVPIVLEAGSGHRGYRKNPFASAGDRTSIARSSSP